MLVSEHLLTPSSIKTELDNLINVVYMFLDGGSRNVCQPQLSGADVQDHVTLALVRGIGNL